jgi:hypothetical protein
MIISPTSLQSHCCDPSLKSYYFVTDSMQQTQEQDIETPSSHSSEDGPSGVLLIPRLDTRSSASPHDPDAGTTPPLSPEDQEMNSPEGSPRPPHDSGSTASTPPPPTKAPSPPHGPGSTASTPPPPTKTPSPPHDSEGPPPPNAGTEDALIASEEVSTSSEQGVRFQPGIRLPLALESIGL